MITLQEAIETAKVKFEMTPSSTIRLADSCVDVGDAWIFSWRSKENPDMIFSGGRSVRVEKDDGKASWFILPGENNYEIMAAGEVVDIAELI